MNELVAYVHDESYVLEPSAGTGDLAVKLVALRKCKVDCIELNKLMFKTLEGLKKKGIVNRIWNGDFRIVGSILGETYDAVVAVPPYVDNTDCDHIRMMYECIKVGGKVIAFTLPYWVTGFYTNQIQFRKWLSTKKYTIRLFEDDQSYLSCPKMLLIIEK